MLQAKDLLCRTSSYLNKFQMAFGARKLSTWKKILEEQKKEAIDRWNKISNSEYSKLFGVLWTLLGKKQSYLIFWVLVIYYLIWLAIILTYKNQECASQHVLKHM